MTQVRSGWLAATFVLLVPTASVRAQTPITAFLPEIDSYFRLSSNVRLVFDAKGYMEDGDLNHAQIGPSLQFNIRPLEKLKRMTIFDLDDIKCMPVVLTFRYRYLPSTVQPAINRVQPIVLFHVPFPGRTLVTDRNRADLDWSAGPFHWTYRNRITAERRLTIRAYHPGAYAAAEFGYQSQFSKWSTTRFFAGCLWPASKHLQLDSYYEHLNNTSIRPESSGECRRANTQPVLPALQGLRAEPDREQLPTTIFGKRDMPGVPQDATQSVAGSSAEHRRDRNTRRHSLRVYRCPNLLDEGALNRRLPADGLMRGTKKT